MIYIFKNESTNSDRAEKRRKWEREYYQKRRLQSEYKEGRKKYYSANREKLVAKQKERYAQPEVKKAHAEYYQRPDIKDKVRDYQKKYQSEHPELKEKWVKWSKDPKIKTKLKKYHRELYKREREQILKRLKDRYSENPAKIIASHRKHAEKFRNRPENKKKQRAYYQEYQSRPDVFARRKEMRRANDLKKKITKCWDWLSDR